jgi:hypothetical protein
MFEALSPKSKKGAEAILEADFKAQSEANELWTRGELPEELIAKANREVPKSRATEASWDRPACRAPHVNLAYFTRPRTEPGLKRAVVAIVRTVSTVSRDLCGWCGAPMGRCHRGQRTSFLV